MIKIVKPNKNNGTSIYIYDEIYWDSVILFDCVINEFSSIYNILSRVNRVVLFMSNSSEINCISSQNIISYCLSTGIEIRVFAPIEMARGINVHLNDRFKNMIFYKSYNLPINIEIGGNLFNFSFKESGYDPSKSCILMRKFVDNRLVKEFIYTGSLELISSDIFLKE